MPRIQLFPLPIAGPSVLTCVGFIYMNHWGTPLRFSKTLCVRLVCLDQHGHGHSSSIPLLSIKAYVSGLCA
jgi:hypothetical protein